MELYTAKRRTKEMISYFEHEIKFIKMYLPFTKKWKRTHFAAKIYR